MLEVFGDVQHENYQRPSVIDKEKLAENGQVVDLQYRNGVPIIMGMYSM